MSQSSATRRCTPQQRTRIGGHGHHRDCQIVSVVVSLRADQRGQLDRGGTVQSDERARRTDTVSNEPGVGGWSYWTLAFRNRDVHNLTATLNDLGREHWELVSSLSTVKTWGNISGNDLVMIFKKPGAGLSPSRELRTRIEGIDPEQYW